MADGGTPAPRAGVPSYQTALPEASLTSLFHSSATCFTTAGGIAAASVPVISAACNDAVAMTVPKTSASDF